MKPGGTERSLGLQTTRGMPTLGAVHFITLEGTVPCSPYTH